MNYETLVNLKEKKGKCLLSELAKYLYNNIIWKSALKWLRFKLTGTGMFNESKSKPLNKVKDLIYFLSFRMLIFIYKCLFKGKQKSNSGQPVSRSCFLDVRYLTRPQIMNTITF